ncbi:hypothetical protein GW17_00059848 [Ensete ventricosum]|nr:hypothetical protein GW17_00059848 [Ensete ventricosum]
MAVAKGNSRDPPYNCYKVPGLSNPILETPHISYLEDRYVLLEELGWGQFGVIRACSDMLTGESVACKSIAKDRLVTPEDIRSIKLEIKVMARLSGHPNVVDLMAVYEDNDYVHLVMELCAGGELFHRLEKHGCFSEHEAAVLFRHLMEVVMYCHDKGVVHRDLKPENILLATKSAELRFPSDPWQSISDSAKDLIGGMLCRDPTQRLTAKQVLEHTQQPEASCGQCHEVSLTPGDLGNCSFSTPLVSASRDVSFNTSSLVPCDRLHALVETLENWIIKGLKLEEDLELIPEPLASTAEGTTPSGLSGKRGWAEAPSTATGWLAKGFRDSERYSQENGVAEEQGDEEWPPPSLSTPTYFPGGNYIGIDVDAERRGAGCDEVDDVLLVEASGVMVRVDFIIVGGH